jgi:hypothetical protein
MKINENNHKNHNVIRKPDCGPVVEAYGIIPREGFLFDLSGFTHGLYLSSYHSPDTDIRVVVFRESLSMDRAASDGLCRKFWSSGPI